MANTSRTKEAVETVDDVVEVPIPVSMFITDASHAIPVAGLLAWRPELVDAELPPSEWELHLASYLSSARP